VPVAQSLADILQDSEGIFDTLLKPPTFLVASLIVISGNVIMFVSPLAAAAFGFCSSNLIYLFIISSR
jgi:hypothetical protein